MLRFPRFLMAAAGGDRLLPSHQEKTQAIQEGAESFSLLDENVPV